MFTPSLRSFAATCGAVLALASCRESSAPDVPAAIVTVLSPASTIALTGTVGDEITDLPTVLVKDLHGAPVPDVQVTFRLVGPGGTLWGTHAVSNAEGQARVGGWQLGPRPGLNVVSATTGGRDTVLFSATARSGPPYVVMKVAGDGQRGVAGTALGVPPRVKVTDAWGNGLEGIAVAFAVEAGGGTLTATDAMSDTAGIADAGSWILGSSGVQRVVARAAGLVSEPFLATAVTPPPQCPLSSTLRSGVTSTSQLSALSCRLTDGRSLETFAIIVAVTDAYVFRMTSGDFDTELELRTWDLRPVASNNDYGSQTNSELKVFLTPGEYVLVASTASSSGAGNYSISYHQPVSADVSRCEEAFLVRGVTVYQTVTELDCTNAESELHDRFVIYLEVGEHLSLEVEDWSYSGPTVEVMSPSGEKQRGEQVEAYTVKLNYVAPVTGFYTLRLGLRNESGMEYRFSVR